MRNQSQPSPDYGAQLLTCREAAEYLGMSLTTVWRMCRERDLPHIRFSQRNYRIPKRALEEWLNSKIQ